MDLFNLNKWILQFHIRNQTWRTRVDTAALSRTPALAGSSAESSSSERIGSATRRALTTQLALSETTRFKKYPGGVFEP